MEETLLLHILNGEASEQEKKEFYSELAKNKESERLFLEVKSLWIRSSMAHTQVDVDLEFEKLWSKITDQKKTKYLSVVRKYLQYAAIVIFILAAGGSIGYFFSKKGFIVPDSGVQKYTAMRGSVSIVEFADGTKVWLNSESELTYHNDLKNKRRHAVLSGEAYFEVKHDDELPFLVDVGGITVRDLGTTFNIKAYESDDFIEASLVEGSIDILSEQGKSLLALNPGESALYYSDENKIEVRSIESNVLSAWRDGKFVIRNQRLEDICKELSRWYSIEFRFENEELRDYRFTGNIKKSTTALHVLKVLKASANFNYRIIENIDKPDIVIVY